VSADVTSLRLPASEFLNRLYLTMEFSSHRVSVAQHPSSIDPHNPYDRILTARFIQAFK